MIGVNLSKRMQIGVGEMIKLRGREFKVVGIFKTGSYEDSQAWISLTDAQKLLNYGTDVSIYYIPDDGPLSEGDNISQGVLVGRRGEAGNSFGNEAMGFFSYLGLIGGLAGVASLITLTSLLWRLTWLHRREFGILRTIGFHKRSVVIYVLTQTFFIIILGSVLGGLFAFIVVLSRISDFSSFGIILAPTWDLVSISIIAGVTLMIVGIGVIIPSKRIYTMSTIDLIGRD
jgi:putative ABC transport system permease protein